MAVQQAGDKGGATGGTHHHDTCLAHAEAPAGLCAGVPRRTQ